jgi:hypothetical protein
MDEPLRLEYACTPEELRQAQELHAGRAMRKTPKWVSILGVLFLCFLVCASVIIGQFVISGLLISLLIIVLLLEWTKRNKPHDETVTTLLEITPREVRLAGDNGWAIMSWSAFGKLLESETLFVLPLANGSAMLVFPKRIFADEQACETFRHMSQQAGQAVELAPVEISTKKGAPETKPGSLQIEVNLQFTDYVDRAIASWRTRIAMVGIAALMLGIFAWASFHRVPNHPLSLMETFVYLCLPVLIVIELGFFLLITLGTWSRHRRFMSTQQIELSDAGLSFSQRESRGAGDWNDRIRYTETHRSFLIWWVDAREWIQIPKREFATQDGIDRCREILATHAQRSIWFFG